LPRENAPDVTVALKAALRTYWSAWFSDHPYEYVARLLLARRALRQLPVNYRRRLEARFFTGGSGLAGAILRADMDARYYAAGEDDQLRQTRALWGGAAGLAWHEDKRACFENDAAFRTKYLRFREPIVRSLDALLRADQRFTTLCEIGTGNGIFAVYLANRFPQLQSIVGLDLSAAQIEQNRDAYRGTAVEFQSGEALDWIERDGRPGTVIVACGTLECLTQAELEQLLRRIHDKLHPAVVALVEPINIDLETVQMSQPRGAMTFSHNYPMLVARNGFEVQFLELTPVDPAIEHYVSVSLVAVSRPKGLDAS